MELEFSETAPHRQPGMSSRPMFLFHSQAMKQKDCDDQEFLNFVLPEESARKEAFVLVTREGVSCYKSRKFFEKNVKKQTAILDVLTSFVSACRDVLRQKSSGVDIVRIMEECHAAGYIVVPEASKQAPLLQQHGLGLVESIARNSCLCHCREPALFICSSDDISVPLCARHRDEEHRGCDQVYPIDSIRVELKSAAIRHIKPCDELLVGQTFVRRATPSSEAFVVVQALDSRKPNSAKWTVRLLGETKNMSWSTFQKEYMPSWGRSCMAWDDAVLMSQSYIFESEAIAWLPLRGLFTGDKAPDAVFRFLESAKLDPTLLSKLKTALTVVDDQDSVKPVAPKDPINEALGLLMKAGKRMVYAGNHPTLSTLSGSTGHRPAGEKVDLVAEPGSIPIKLGPQLLKQWHWTNPNHPSAGVAGWADGPGIGRPMVYLHPPGTMGGFGIHAEQRSIESINITSAETPWPVVWQFMPLNQDSTLRLARLQGACNGDDKTCFYKSAFPCAALLGSKVTVVSQKADTMVGGRAFHWGLSLGKVALAQQYTSESWCLLDVPLSNEIPAAADPVAGAAADPVGGAAADPVGDAKRRRIDTNP